MPTWCSGVSEIGALRAELGRVFDFIEAVRGYLPEGYEDALRRHEQLKESHAALSEEHQEMTAEHRELRDRVVAMRDTAILQEAGVYDYQHPMENSDEYRDRLKAIRDEIKASARDGRAVTHARRTWTVNDSEAKGRKMIKDTSKLLLRAYNNEADMLADKMRPFRLDLVNLRREFFYATPQEVHDALNSEDGLAVVTEFTDTPEAAEWHESENTRRKRSDASNGHDAQVTQTT